MKQEDYRTYILNKEFGVVKEEKKDIINNLNITIKVEPIFDGSNLVDDKEESEQQIGDVEVIRHFKDKK